MPDELEWPMLYDINQDVTRKVTQADVDQLIAIAKAASIKGHPDFSQQEGSFTFQLAVYRNRMRDDCVFVAEKKEILPYDGAVRNLDGSRIYPSYPDTQFALGNFVSPPFAKQLVHRWNNGAVIEQALELLRRRGP